MKRIFLTGGTGFLGRYLIRELKKAGHEIYALVRSETLAKVNLSEHFDGVTFIKGNLNLPQICETPEDREMLKERVTDVIHAAALYDLEANRESLYLANVVGTHHLIHLASEMRKIREFHHVSTMAVAGNHHGLFQEDYFGINPQFSDPYGETKYLAEAAIRNWKTDTKKTIHRLGILVGDSKTGEIDKVDGPYYVLRTLKRLHGIMKHWPLFKVLPFPFCPNARIYLLGGDIAANAIVRTTERPSEQEIRTYHIMGQEGGVTIPHLLKLMLDHLGTPKILMPVPQNRLLPSVLRHFDIPERSLSYLYSPCRFSVGKITADFPEIKFPKIDQYSETLFSYACRELFLGRNS